MIDKKHTNKILKIITSSSALKVFKETQRMELLRFYNQLETLLKMDIPYGELGEKFILCIALTFGDQREWNIFDKSVLASKIRKGLLDKNNVILSNVRGDVVNVVKGVYIHDQVEAQNFSEKEDRLVFFIKYMEVHLFINGKVIHYIANIMRSSREGVETPESLPAREYRQLIKNQYDNMVYKERGFKYWKNKNGRILVHSPEIHFHKPLWWYLDQKIVDGKVDSGATISGTDDRTDIRILTFNGEIYIIEIKCLGKTESSPSEKSDDWANKGLIQINIYLKDEKQSTKGVLVLYDGRKKNRKIIWDSKIVWNPKVDGNPMRFFLESESASVKAKKIYTKMKKGK